MIYQSEHGKWTGSSIWWLVQGWGKSAQANFEFTLCLCKCTKFLFFWESHSWSRKKRIVKKVNSRFTSLVKRFSIFLFSIVFYWSSCSCVKWNGLWSRTRRGWVEKSHLSKKWKKCKKWTSEKNENLKKKARETAKCTFPSPLVSVLKFLFNFFYSAEWQ